MLANQSNVTGKTAGDLNLFSQGFLPEELKNRKMKK